MSYKLAMRLSMTCWILAPILMIAAVFYPVLLIPSDVCVGVALVTTIAYRSYSLKRRSRDEWAFAGFAGVLSLQGSRHVSSAAQVLQHNDQP